MKPEHEVIYCLRLSHNNNTVYRHGQTHVDGTGAAYFSLSLPPSPRLPSSYDKNGVGSLSFDIIIPSSSSKVSLVSSPSSKSSS